MKAGMTHTHMTLEAPANFFFFLGNAYKFQLENTKGRQIFGRPWQPNGIQH